jgi:hypothetical protein
MTGESHPTRNTPMTSRKDRRPGSSSTKETSSSTKETDVSEHIEASENPAITDLADIEERVISEGLRNAADR